MSQSESLRHDETLDADAHPTTLRDVMRGVAATVVIVTTGSSDGDRHAMTASSFTSVSLEPPTVLVCIRQTARIHAPLLMHQRMAINILAPSQQALGMLCAGGPAPHRFDDADWRFDQHGLPYLAHAQAVLFCDVQQTVEAGTHTIVLGTVDRALNGTHADPLLYLDSKFVSLASSAS